MVTVALAVALMLGAAAAQGCDIEVLGQDRRAVLPEDYRNEIVEPGPYQQRLVEYAKDFLTPLACFAVDHVAFVERAPEDAGATGWVRIHSHNDIVHLDARPASLSNDALDPATNRSRGVHGDIWAGGIDAIAHEGTHAAVHLLNSQSDVERCKLPMVWCDPVDPNQWSPAAQAAARAAVEHMRLRSGIVEEWVRMHEAFVAAGMATDFGAYEGSQHDATAITAAGFTSLYGSTKPGEDIAEWVAKTQVGDLQGASFEGATVTATGEDLGCMVLRSSGDRITNRTAAAYTKVAFLRDVGLVSEEAFTRCVGAVHVDTHGRDGLHMTNNDDSVGTLDERLRAVIGRTATGAWTFQFTAEGTAGFGDTTSPAVATLTIDLASMIAAPFTSVDEVSWPRGLYVIGDDAQFRVDLEDAPAGSFVGTVGFVLVTRASNDLLEGSIVLQRGERPGAFGVPETEKWLPSPITFRMTGGSLTGP